MTAADAMEQELVAVVRQEFERSAGAADASAQPREHLPEEVEEGNVEYKLKLTDPPAGECGTRCIWYYYCSGRRC